MVGTEGVDYAWSRPNIAQLAAAGKRLAVRYVSWDTTGKNLSAAEAKALSSAGIAVVTNWEWDARDQLGGYNVGVQHAREADRQHRACGGPAGRPIYFSTDFDATSAQLAGPVAQYFRGAADEIGLARVGVYGGIRTVRYLLDNGLVRWAWQTYAWSGGAWDPRANLQQYRNGVSLAGGTVDLDRAMTADYGQWTVGGEMPLSDPTLRAYFEEYDGYHGVSPKGWFPKVLEQRLGVRLDQVAGDTGAMRTTITGLASQVAGLSTTVNTLAEALRSGGNDLDTAAVLARIDQRATEDAERDRAAAEREQQLLARIAGLETDLAAYRQAEADAQRAAADRLDAE